MRRLACVIVAMMFAGCGGGGDGGGHSPAISNLQFSPTSASVGAGGGTFVVNGTIDVTDSGGDLATLEATTYDSAGNPVGNLSVPLSGLAGVRSVTLGGSITFSTSTVGVFTYKVQVMDAAGSASNILQGTFAVTQAYSQADVTGTWDIVSILSGGNAGWFHATADFDASGNATAITDYLDSAGNTNPGTLNLRWTIDSTGEVSQFENNVITGLHGKMSSDKKLISWIGTQDVLTHTVQMTIARKRTGTVFSNADLASIPFAYHSLATGSDNHWEYGAGNTNALGQLTITSTTLPPGYSVSLPPPNYDTFSVNPAGIVTLANDTSYYGLMTDDKKVIFTIMGDQISGDYGFMVTMMTGQTYTQADYAGAFSFVALRNSLSPTWTYGVGAIDAAGNGTYLSYVGPPSPLTYTRHLSATGVITDPTDSTFHGQMSYNKNITTRTNTSAAGNYGMNITFR